jgi:hypothetical protein
MLGENTKVKIGLWTLAAALIFVLGWGYNKLDAHETAISDLKIQEAEKNATLATEIHALGEKIDDLREQIRELRQSK